MKKDQLFILKPGFFKGSEGPFYCSDSVPVEGMLSFFPQLRNAVEVHYIEAAKPRTAIVALLGEQHQSAPVLVLAEGRQDLHADVQWREHAGVRFIDDPSHIQRYLSLQHGVAIAG